MFVRKIVAYFCFFFIERFFGEKNKQLTILFRLFKKKIWLYFWSFFTKNLPEMRKNQKCATNFRKHWNIHWLKNWQSDCSPCARTCRLYSIPTCFIKRLPAVDIGIDIVRMQWREFHLCLLYETADLVLFRVRFLQPQSYSCHHYFPRVKV